ncbi:MAG TPA: LuxR C-terminal-related transcriptional regulator [Gaiellaceae bacterium]|nr:LuxR C-terminal-related transcriptional regulator [Gaiellaceae bacterium]
MRAETSPVAELTPRELDVLRLIAQGQTNRGIGKALHLSESAVEKHVSAIFGKLRLAPEPSVDRRVNAVLTFLRETADGRELGAAATT